MAKKTFIPNWYIDKKILIKNKKTKIYIMIILIVNTVLLSFLLNNSNGVKNTEQEVGNSNDNAIIVETIKPDTIAIDKYKELSDFLEENNLNYKNILITKGYLEIDIEVKNYEEYIHVIRTIESHYSIKRLTPKIKNEGNFDLKVILEV